MRWPLLLCLAACGESIGPRELHYELGRCGVVDLLDEDFGEHVPQATVIEWSTNPPASGPHFELWAAWDRSYESLERGFWLHNAEHGAIVLAYRCDEGCAPEVAQLEEVVRQYPIDPMCQTPVKHRALVVNDPQLPDGVPFAAIAWGVTYTATCVDPDALAQFHSDFYARAPENFCADGVGLGGTPIE